MLNTNLPLMKRNIYHPAIGCSCGLHTWPTLLQSVCNWKCFLNVIDAWKMYYNKVFYFLAFYFLAGNLTVVYYFSGHLLSLSISRPSYIDYGKLITGAARYIKSMPMQYAAIFKAVK